jgi:hypothetical protein
MPIDARRTNLSSACAVQPHLHMVGLLIAQAPVFKICQRWQGNTKSTHNHIGKRIFGIVMQSASPILILSV